MYSLLALNPIIKTSLFNVVEAVLQGKDASLDSFFLFSTLVGIVMAIIGVFRNWNFTSFIIVLICVGYPFFDDARNRQNVSLEISIGAAIFAVVATYIFILLILFLHHIGFFRLILCVLKFIFYFIVFAVLGGIGGVVIVWAAENFFDYQLVEQTVMTWSAVIVGMIAAISSLSDD